MSDIVETLRDGADDLGAQEFCPYLAKAADKAADEIVRLRSALEEIANMDTGCCDSDTDAMYRMMNTATLALGVKC